MSCRLLGLGTALPPYSITQENAFAHAQRFAPLTEKQTRLLHTIYRRTNVRQRYSVLLDSSGADLDFYPPVSGPDDAGPTTQQRMVRFAVEVGPLAIAACKKALADANLDAGQITHLVSVCCTGFFSPGLDAHLIRELNLPRWVARTQVGFMGCHGAINGLRATLAFGGDPNATILLCAAELCSLHFRYGWHPQTAVANSLFADGAAAIVARQNAAAADPGWNLAACASFLLPDSAADMTWIIGDHGFEMTLSDRVPDLIKRHLRPWLEHFLRTNQLGLSDVGSWVVHPGGPSIVDAAAQCLELGEQAVEDSRHVLAQCGNMSSPTVLFILERLRRRGAKRPCVMLAFGPGLIAEAALWV